MDREGDFWLGGSDLHLEGGWVWESFEYMIMEEDMKIWAPGSPSPSIENNCMFMRYDNVDKVPLWHEGRCSDRKYGLCYD